MLKEIEKALIALRSGSVEQIIQGEAFLKGVLLFAPPPEKEFIQSEMTKCQSRTFFARIEQLRIELSQLGKLEDHETEISDAETGLSLYFESTRRGELVIYFEKDRVEATLCGPKTKMELNGTTLLDCARLLQLEHQPQVFKKLLNQLVQKMAATISMSNRDSDHFLSFF